MAPKAQLEVRIVELNAALDAALALNERLVAANEKAMNALATAQAALVERDTRIASLEERLARLEARVKTSSENSSLPPSKNPPHVKPGRGSKPTGKPAGGQPGHAPHHFAAIDPADVTRTVECTPATRCDYCLADLTDAPLVLSPEPAVHHQLDVPPLALEVVAFVRPKRQCDHCQHWTTAPLPSGVKASPFGHRLVALIASLTIRYRLGRRPVAALLADLFGRGLSIGAIQTALESASAAVEGVVEELKAAVTASPAAGIDETGWRDQEAGFTRGKRAWLFVATTPASTVFHIASNRGVDGSLGVLGAEFGGMVTCDRWRPYQSRFGRRRQLCWAHLDREAQGALDRGAVLAKKKDAKLVFRGEQLVAWGKAFSSVVDRLFAYWHAFKEGRLSRKELRQAMTPVRLCAAKLLRRGRRLDDRALAATCRDLWRQFGCLWRFVTVEGIEPTNNASERQLRPGVILRGLMNSTKSAAGRTLFARLLSVSATCRQQSRDLLDFLHQALEARARGLAPPPLLPG